LVINFLDEYQTTIFDRSQQGPILAHPGQKKKDISVDILVEYVLNYGDYDSCKLLFDTLGTQYVAKIFYNHIKSDRKRLNYFPEILKFFSSYFEINAPGSSQ
jgi:NAD-dependent oxidoreductase involved in siderophore biosynthesis